MKKITVVILVCVALFLFVGLMPVHGEEKIYDSVVRLHILANSDSEEDQALKLAVRDEILEVTAPLLDGCSDRATAEAVLRSHTEEIAAAADRVIRAAGRNDAVRLEFDEEEYPERGYDGFCFPAGTYLSLRVLIGAGEGHNWWCCLFPPVCRAAAAVGKEEAEEAFIAVGLTPEQYRVITESNSTVYRVRFKILELFRKK